ncbi:MAG: hypothetical protein A2073_03630 [Deltaproteobacteria bacterium GWC2_42_11]|nr:MAG: hypothetical protein A2073_03630 [Deltaproteobacteria bacterium GWC2_42_11]HBO83646.1 hypothetical protein [Deltaproteobacteria bacterium]
MKGGKDYWRFKAGEILSYRQAVLAQCFICNGGAEGGGDCKGRSCPLYQFMPYRADKPKLKRTLSSEHLKKMQLAKENRLKTRGSE